MVFRSFIGGGDQAGVAFAAANNCPLAGATVNDATEANVQMTIRDAGTFSNSSILIPTSNANIGTVNWNFRKNAANGNQSVSIGNTTGLKQDTTHTDTVVAGDKVNYQIGGGGTVNFTPMVFYELFDSTSSFSPRSMTTSSQTYTTGSSFSAINGKEASASNEAGINTKMQKAGTMKFLACELSANAKTSTMTFISRIGTPTMANGNMTMTIAAGGTGIQEDTTHTDTIAVNNLWNSSRVVGTDTTNSTTWQSTGSEFTSSTNFIVEASADADVVGTASTTKFVPLGGRLAFGSTESQVQAKALANFAYSGLSVEHSAGTSTHTVTINFRKNTANGNQTVTAGTATGQYADTTNTDTVVPTDLVNYAFTFGASTQASFSHCATYGTFTATINQTVLVEWEE